MRPGLGIVGTILNGIGNKVDPDYPIEARVLENTIFGNGLYRGRLPLADTGATATSSVSVTLDNTIVLNMWLADFGVVEFGDSFGSTVVLTNQRQWDDNVDYLWNWNFNVYAAGDPSHVAQIAMLAALSEDKYVLILNILIDYTDIPLLPSGLCFVSITGGSLDSYEADQPYVQGKIYFKSS